MDDEIQTIKQQFLSVLDEFKKCYVMYHKNPEVNEYQSCYANRKSQLQQLNNSMAHLSTTVHQQIAELNQHMQTVSKRLGSKERQQLKMSRQMSDLTNRQNGSQQLTDDSKTMYEHQLSQNVLMLLAIVCLSKAMSQAMGLSFFVPLLLVLFIFHAMHMQWS